MNLLYLTLTNIERKEFAGANKKIEGQIKAFKNHGVKTYKIAIKNFGLYAFYDNKEKLLKKSHFKNKFEIIERRFLYYKHVIKFIEKQDIKVVYIRYPLFDLFFINFVKVCKNRGLKILLELPTFPYDKELSGIRLFVDKFFRRFLYKYVDYIVTYSKHETIFGIRTIKIENGIDVESIKVSKQAKESNTLDLIGVAYVNKWHGYDRVITGVAEYYKKNPRKEVVFHIVGNGPELENLKVLTKKLNLEKYVKFYGFKSGDELDKILDNCDIGIGSLGMHRIGLEKGFTLKLREYCAKGIPFIYGYFDKDFEDFKYSLRVPNDDSPIDIEKIINFYETIKNENYVEKMRKYAIEKLSWNTKIKPVIEKIKG
ncbi:glycosyltransferase [Thermosipho atlanticus]|uniref:Glycosyltransferase involved in cell wall bisynthesis n=1 Tax=Thermosipho atlanticus DSM 15807 TaxID=1123380 RepID=A0A1M5RNP0_9BACT|nr:glycosyltransferase [Thermosipho atlanticus]SHH27977.1 Glycosyltransferase involved in cell wall bisynthesis [Thermosipho atlanticus DSM 15807]